MWAIIKTEKALSSKDLVNKYSTRIHSKHRSNFYLF